MNEVLVVDDDHAIQRLLKSALTAEGFTVRCADDGRAALEAIEASEPDVMILDLQMPGLDGRAVLAELRKRDGLMPVLVISAGDPRSVAREFGVAGIAKPFDLDRLLEEVARLAAFSRHDGGDYASNR